MSERPPDFIAATTGVYTKGESTFKRRPGIATYDLTLLEKSIAKWQSSPAVRAVYESIYHDMASRALPGPAIEVGSGCGTAREFITGLVTTDVRKTPFVDHAASAYELESVPGGPWATIYALDVLHHLRTPLQFFASAARCLAPGGRIVIVDPAATLLGRQFYRLFHHEPTLPQRLAWPYEFPADSDRGDFANMGMSWALFARDINPVRARLAGLGLSIRAVHFRDVVAYAASGGFSGPKLLPPGILRRLLVLEQRLPQILLRAIALRMVVVLEKKSDIPCPNALADDQLAIVTASIARTDLDAREERIPEHSRGQ